MGLDVRAMSLAEVYSALDVPRLTISVPLSEPRNCIIDSAMWLVERNYPRWGMYCARARSGMEHADVRLQPQDILEDIAEMLAGIVAGAGIAAVVDGQTPYRVFIDLEPVAERGMMQGPWPKATRTGPPARRNRRADAAAVPGRPQ